MKNYDHAFQKLVDDGYQLILINISKTDLIFFEKKWAFLLVFFLSFLHYLL